MKKLIVPGALLFLITSWALVAEPSGYTLPAVKIAVTDVQKTIDFYSTLGMKVGQKYNAFEQQLRWGDDSQGPNIVLMDANHERVKLRPGGAFLVFGVPDMAATIKQLREAGFADVGAPRDFKQFLILITKDPDGNTIELVQAVEGASP